MSLASNDDTFTVPWSYCAKRTLGKPWAASVNCSVLPSVVGGSESDYCTLASPTCAKSC